MDFHLPYWAEQGISIITAFATLVMAFAALRSVHFSKQVAEENRLLRQRGETPEVISYLELEGAHNDDVALVVHNVGQGVARDVQLEIKCKEEEKFIWFIDNIPLNKKLDPLPYLAPGKVIRIRLGNLHQLIGSNSLPPFTAVTYYNDSISKMKAENILDVGVFVVYGQHYDSGYEIANIVKQHT